MTLALAGLMIACSAWFTGKANTVRFCVEVASDFGFSKEELEKKVIGAYRTWSEYMSEKKVTSFEEPGEVKALTHCDGSEDLKFLFGVTDAVVNLQRARFENPISITVRAAYDARAGWGKGFIWFAPMGSISYSPEAARSYDLHYPNWSLEGNLDTILLHELGHVHGTGHIEGTIMTANIAKMIRIHQQSEWLPIHTIDDKKELVSCETCEKPVSGVLGLNDEYRMTTANGTYTFRTDTRAENFERLFGRKPQGEIKAQLDGNDKKGYRLTVSDDLRSHEFALTIQWWSKSKSLGSPAFKSIRRPDPARYSRSPEAFITTYDVANHLSSVAIGSLTTLKSETLQISLQRNMSLDQPHNGLESSRDFNLTQIVSPLMIVIQEESGAKLLFVK